MDKLKLAAFSAFALVLTACGAGSYEYPYQNPKLPTEKRVDNLMSLLTPEEKIGLLMNKNISIDRLGIPSYNWWSEACHGIRQDGYTVYPQYIAMAASFNPGQVLDIFTTISDEARANWNRSQREFDVDFGARYYPGNPELSFWCPNVNIVRDPRWGRGQETPGEDPYLSTVMGVQTVLGMQGSDDRYYKTHACAKHYAVHSGPEPLRHKFDVTVSQRDLWETYLPAFKALVTEAGVREVMCAYHRYEGVPCCSNDRLLTNILREKWDYDGIIVTDCDAISNYYNKGQHETQPDAESASINAILHGTDLECGISFISLVEAYNKGLVHDSDIDPHVRRVLTGRFELGMFDPAEMLPWADLGPEVISCEEHDALAVQSARESMVLLKNDGLLPLSKDLRKIAVVGPNADDTYMLNGNYGGTPSAEHTRTILEGIRRAVPGVEVFYSRACPIDDERRTFRPWTTPNDVLRDDQEKYDKDELATFKKLSAQVRDADVIIVVGGITAHQEGEGGDRPDIELPNVQKRLLKAMRATGRPVLFVNCSGSAMALASVEDCYDALIQAWYPGQGGPYALADIIFGDCNPSAKLPVTFYASTDQLPDFQNYDMAGRTYRYFEGEPLYPFGFGLSYTTFEYGTASLSKTRIKAGRSVEVTVPVTNTGEREGAEVVQVYVKSLDNPDAPIKSLKGFRKVTLAPGETAQVKITLGADAFEYYDAEADGLSVYPGAYKILYGSSSADPDLKSLDLQVI